MEPMAPDWRSIGGPSTQPAPQAAGPGRALSTRHLVAIAGAFVATLVLGAVVTLAVMPGTGGVLIDGPGGGLAPADAGDASALRTVAGLGPAASTSPRTFVVDVEGAVVRRGLVHVPAGSRVGDALELAGGFAANVDLAAAAETLNLAQEVTDGLKIAVPALGDAPAAGTGATGTAGTPGDAGGGLVDLNRGTEAELDGLPGVGPATIAKIVAAREEAPFTSVDELRSRGLVGEATFGKLRDLVTVGR